MSSPLHVSALETLSAVLEQSIRFAPRFLPLPQPTLPYSISHHYFAPSFITFMCIIFQSIKVSLFSRNFACVSTCYLTHHTAFSGNTTQADPRFQSPQARSTYWRVHSTSLQSCLDCFSHYCILQTFTTASIIIQIITNFIHVLTQRQSSFNQHTYTHFSVSSRCSLINVF